MDRALYLEHPLIQLARGGMPTQQVGDTSSTFLGREGLGEVNLGPPPAPLPSLPQPPAVPQPPEVLRAGIGL